MSHLPDLYFQIVWCLNAHELLVVPRSDGDLVPGDLQHPNIVRSFAMEEDEEFIYLALERCRESLADLMKNSPQKDNYFLTSEGRPTSMCLQARHLRELH